MVRLILMAKMVPGIDPGLIENSGGPPDLQPKLYFVDNINRL
jgi:hypothetical protein